MKRGYAFAVATYMLWGVLPIYWKLIQSVPALEIVGHRMMWSFVFVSLIVLLKRDWGKIRSAVRDKKNLITFFATAVLLSANWLIYVWAVNAGFIVETSLGYFINPLVNVVLGVLFLKEKLRLWQWIPVGIATVGVLYLTVSYGSLPWISLSLAFTFGFYGLLKKTASLNSIQGFTIETGFMFVPASMYLIFLGGIGSGAFGTGTLFETIMLILSGVATGLPLLLFGAAAQRIDLSTLGFFQYIAPTLQFLIGVLIYKEGFNQDQMVGFGLIWTALLIFTLDSFFENRRGRKVSKLVDG
jgi:chloramphenicol-sensitive protein RarD